MAGRRKLGSASLKTGRLIWPCLAGERGPDGRGKWPYATTIPTTDFAALIAEKAAAKESLTADITALEENLETIKADLKAKKAELKKLDNELSKLEEQKAEADAKAAEEAQRAELEDTIQKLMATGVSAAEILEKLK